MLRATGPAYLPPARLYASAAGSADGVDARAVAFAARDRVVQRAALHEPRREPVGRDRLAEVVALRDVAVERGERLPRDAVLDAFRHDAQAEVAAEVDDRAHDRRVGLVGAHRVDERTVDLHLVHGQPLEV